MPEFSFPSRGTASVEVTPDGGIVVICDCGTATQLVLQVDGSVQDGHELAVTCGGCQSPHWLTLRAVTSDG
jgi:hypothetical protein